ncbi:MAG: hypothetical protein GYB33_15735 [Gammaproteobacteria bacterium]|nr:hypothetical protein [Gammaproteobacteria bacterium]NHN39225.1 hypothetical protein [Pseudomaricurvus alcaniphilus]
MFRAVIDRRSSANVQGLADALQAVQQQPAADLETRLQNVLRAFLKPIVEKSLRGGEGWRNYVRLLAQVAQLPQEETFLRPATDQSDAVVMLFIDELRKILPAMSAEDLHWSFYFYQAAITHVLVESGIVDRQSQGLCKASDLDTIVEKMTRFFSAGFLAMSSVITEPALKAGY